MMCGSTLRPQYGGPGSVPLRADVVDAFRDRLQEEYSWVVRGFGVLVDQSGNVVRKIMAARLGEEDRVPACNELASCESFEVGDVDRVDFSPEKRSWACSGRTSISRSRRC
jgi:hypothetical protein